MNKVVIASIGAIVVLLGVLAVLLLLGLRSKLTKASTTVLTIIALVAAAALGVTVHWGDLVLNPTKTPPASARDVRSFGLRLRSVQWVHDYFPNGDFRGKLVYDVECRSDYRVRSLLPDEALWFGHGIKYSLHAEIVDANREKYKLTVASHLLPTASGQRIRGIGGSA